MRNAEGDGGSGSFAEVERYIEVTRQRLPGYPHERVKLARLVTHVQKRQSDLSNAVLKRHGLNYVKYTALMMMYGTPGRTLTPSTLSEGTGEKPANITRICDELLQQGLIERHPSAEDRRRVDLHLTREGERLIEKLQPELWQVWDEIYGCFNAAELRQLTRLLRKPLARLDASG
ncbi:MAG: MarR family transcriptional regulator [Nevskia sp.]|nr:MarR family transcriptional regulator [Nevskia sp.]